MKSGYFIQKKETLTDLLLICMIMFSSLMVFQLKGKTFFLIFQILWCGWFFLKYKKIYLYHDVWFNVVMLSAIPTLITAVVSNVKTSYVRCAIYSAALLVVLYFACVCFYEYLKKKPDWWARAVRLIKWMCLIQIGWCLLEYVAYRFAGIDLNDTIFVQKLHMVSTASFYKSGVKFMPTGFCWHPIIMAPILVLAYLLFDGWWVKLLVVATSLVSGNATVFIGTMACIGMDVVVHIGKALKSKRISSFVLVVLVAILVAGLIVMTQTSVPDILMEKFSTIIKRISGTAGDASASAHMRYYTSYPKLVEISSAAQVLFGYGESCSGYPIGVLFDQYTAVKSWAVETDIMNILISRGIIGFLIFYGWLARIAIKGWKINYKYTILILTIMVEGITYNVQFDWIMMIEMFCMAAIDNKLDIFSEKFQMSVSKARAVQVVPMTVRQRAAVNTSTEAQ